MLATLLRQDPSLALATDQYELTMAMGYWKNGMAERDAVFQMFYRTNPFGNGFVVNAGLATFVDFLREFKFSRTDLDYLATLKGRKGGQLFSDGFLRYLEELKFTCDIDAVPEGTVVFPHEPLMRVRGPILQAQLLEGALLNTINFQSLIATKASRVCLAAEGDPVIDFGLRRAQGLDGALSASRACYIGGCVGTSNVLAGKLLGIPVMGTHGHSWVMAFDSEIEAFRAFADTMPDNCLFLVDTYGTADGVRHAIEIGHQLRDEGYEMVGVRLDSGDLAYFSKMARKMLDEAGMPDALVLGSNELDEFVIRSLKSQGAKLNAWGVGTNLITAKNDPALSGVYKLTAMKKANSEVWDYKLKLSEQRTKISVPGILQAYRFFDGSGKMRADAVVEVDENPEAVDSIIDPNDNTHIKRISKMSRFEPLLQPVYRAGELVAELPSLEEIRARTAEQMDHLDDSHKRFEFPHMYPVGLSPALNTMRDNMIRRERDLLNGNG